MVTVLINAPRLRMLLVAANNLLNIDIDGNTLATSIASTGDDATTATALATAINADGTLSALVTADASANHLDCSNCWNRVYGYFISS